MNHKLLAILCLTAAIILGVASSFLTANFFYSSGNGGFWGYVLIAIGLMFDFGKFAFAALAAFLFERDKFVPAIAFSFLCVICVVVSFGASQAQDLNKVNEISNETITTSDDYIRQGSIFKVTSSTIEQLTKDIASLRSTKQAEIQASTEGLKSQKNALPRDYITQRNNIQSKINKTAANTKNDIEEQIRSKENELKSKTSSLSSINKDFKNIGDTIKPTKGIYALAAWINPKDPVGTVGTLNTIKNWLIEIIAIAFSIAFGSFISLGYLEPNNDSNGIIDRIGRIFKKPATVGFKNGSPPPPKIDVLKNKIGFQVKNSNALPLDAEHDYLDRNTHKTGLNEIENGINGLKVNKKQEQEFNSKVEKYRKIMEKTARNNICIGYMKIGDQAELSKSETSEIYGHLKQSGIIEVIGVKTFIKQHLG